MYVHMILHMGHGVQGHATVGLLDTDTARQVAETMQALATGSRVRILASLREAPRSVGDLATALDMEQSAVSHQLRTLRLLGLVVGERVGRQTIYALHDSHVGDLLEEAVFHVQHLRLGLAVKPGELREAL